VGRSGTNNDFGITWWARIGVKPCKSNSKQLSSRAKRPMKPLVKGRVPKVERSGGLQLGF
jgi:hypothetical protein